MSRPAQSVEARVDQRAKDLWRRYGLTVDQYDKQYAHQGGCCMYCHKPGKDLTAGNSSSDRPMVPDEEHDPPFRFRGLAHPKCNQLAGIYEAALKDPPAYGVVDHVVSSDRVAARVRREDMARTRTARLAGRTRPEPGPRTTYQAADWRGNGRATVAAEDEDEDEDDQAQKVPTSHLDKLRNMTRPEPVSFSDKMRAARVEHTGETSPSSYQVRIKETMAELQRRPDPPPPVYATPAQLSYLATMAMALGERTPSEWTRKTDATRLINEWKPRFEAKKLRDHPVRETRKRLAKKLRKDGKQAMRAKGGGRHG